MPVRQLSEAVVNRIAAGEVVERPASVVKELVENALDAGARRIDVLTDGGGRRLIRVSDDGEGMTRADLELSVERHATSKLDDDDLLSIRTLGFRGEALPSIGAAARLTITTRHASEPHAWSIAVDAGEKSAVKPAALGQGTTVEVRDLFYATPARLKFLKADRSEAEAVREVVRRLAMSRPDVSFTLAGEERAPVTWGPATCSARTSVPMPLPSTPNAKACASPALPACRPFLAPIRLVNICSSMDGRSATSCFMARCVHPMPTICRATGIHCSPFLSHLIHGKWT
jgi:DNA mismatch repair protein MutL